MKSGKNVRYLTQLALLTALMLVMANTFLGYIRVGLLTMSLMTVPLAIGAMLCGPAAGAWLGFVFGMTSFFIAVNGTGGLTAYAFQYSPVLCFLMCVGARVLCGLLVGLLYRAFVRLLPGRDKLCCVLGGLCAPLLNTLLFMGSMVAFFYNMDFVQAQVAKLGAANPLMFVILSVGLQGALEAVICTVVAAAVTIPLKKFLHD